MNRLLLTAYSFLTAAGLVTVARWFHPATFSALAVPILLALFALCLVFYLWHTTNDN